MVYARIETSQQKTESNISTTNFKDERKTRISHKISFAIKNPLANSTEMPF